LPKSVEYDAHFWHGILKRLNQGDYAQWRESVRFVFEGKVAKWLNNLTGEQIPPSGNVTNPSPPNQRIRLRRVRLSNTLRRSQPR